MNATYYSHNMISTKKYNYISHVDINAKTGYYTNSEFNESCHENDIGLLAMSFTFPLLPLLVISPFSCLFYYMF